MNSAMQSQLDEVGWKLLELLQENARMSYRELGAAVGLSAPAVAERVRRLEESGIISGYHAVVNPARIGRPVLALIRLSGVSDRAPHVSAALSAREAILSCHRVTGEDSYVIIAAVASIAALEELIDDLLAFGHLTTALVLSSPVLRRTLRRP